MPDDDDESQLKRLDVAIQGLSTLEKDLNVILKEAITQDVVGPSSKSAMERLLYLSVIGIALSTFAKPGWKEILHLQPQPGYEWAFPIGLALIIVYFIAAVVESAYRDRQRWLAQLRMNAGKVRELANELSGLINHEAGELRAFVSEMNLQAAADPNLREDVVRREISRRRESINAKAKLHKTIARTLSRRHLDRQLILYAAIPLSLGAIAIAALILSVFVKPASRVAHIVSSATSVVLPV